MRIFINTLREFKELQKLGVNSEGLAERSGLSRGFVLKALKYAKTSMTEWHWMQQVSVDIPGTQEGPIYCPGCGGKLLAVPCLKCKCEGRVTRPRALRRKTA